MDAESLRVAFGALVISRIRTGASYLDLRYSVFAAKCAPQVEQIARKHGTSPKLSVKPARAPELVDDPAVARRKLQAAARLIGDARQTEAQAALVALIATTTSSEPIVMLAALMGRTGNPDEKETASALSAYAAAFP